MLHIWTDGSCIGNPGPGGWAWYCPELSTSDSGHILATTNNRAELIAIIEALRSHLSKDVKIFTDSQWAIRTIISNRKADNLDLLHMVWKAQAYREVEYQWVRAHVGNPQNDVVDRLAYQAARRD